MPIRLNPCCGRRGAVPTAGLFLLLLLLLVSETASFSVFRESFSGTPLQRASGGSRKGHQGNTAASWKKWPSSTGSATTSSSSSQLSMVLTPPSTSSSSPLSPPATNPSKRKAMMTLPALHSSRSSAGTTKNDPTASDRKRKVRRKYKRKRIPETEREVQSIRAQMQHEYEKLCQDGQPATLWSFESLFPEPVWDEVSVQRDLYEVRKRDSKTQQQRDRRRTSASSSSSSSSSSSASTTTPPPVPRKMKSSYYGGSSMMRIWREPRLSSAYLPDDNNAGVMDENKDNQTTPPAVTPVAPPPPTSRLDPTAVVANIVQQAANQTVVVGRRDGNATGRIDKDMTRMVEDRLYGYRRTPTGDFQYDTSLMGEGAVQFREGIRLGNPLRVNADRLNYFARKELQHGKIEEAVELYEKAIAIDPRDGRAYLGLGRCAERRRDFKLAREYLRAGIANSVSVGPDGVTVDRGGNPFLLQALGCLEEKMGDLAQAEALYIAAAKSRPSHAAAWVALARLRTTKLGQSAQAGRVCYQTAERELRVAGRPASSHVYTAWAALEYHKAGDVRRARELFNMAIDVDHRCSAAYLQLGVMEGASSNWEAAEDCFDKVLKFDKRNSRVLQAYALMETKKPGGSSRKAIGLFERALKANRRDAGVLQSYALYVARLGDMDGARRLLQQGTQINKRDAAVWQAWGVLEAQHGSASEARKIFQQGIWDCAQLTGGQSGGYRCARLWQAWGVLEAREGDHAAARRCFSRALDADSRNIPAMTAWASMEEKLGNISDARSIFERALNKFAAGSDEKNSLWRSYELMEQRLGHVVEAQKVYQRAMREALAVVDIEQSSGDNPQKMPSKVASNGSEMKKVLKKTADQEVEVVRWNGLGGEVWLNDRAIESKVPRFKMKRRKYDS